MLVHCSDGWDRTAQVCATAQLLIDPFYRTHVGFATLVEKEWCAFGHQFGKRSGHGSPNFSDDQRSPIFIQWLDCVWQIWNQFPTAFEFNEAFLIFLAESLYSCKFGTFLYDCEKHRKATDLQNRTKSVWDEAVKPEFLNSRYAHAETSMRLKLQCVTRCLAVWPYHYRYNVEMKGCKTSAAPK